MNSNFNGSNNNLNDIINSDTTNTNQNNLNIDIGELTNLSNQETNNFNSFNNEIKAQIDSMWTFILYNKFIDKRVIELHTDKILLNNIIERKNDIIKNLEYDIQGLEVELDDCKYINKNLINKEQNKNKRKSPVNLTCSNIFGPRPKRLTTQSKREIDEDVKQILNKLKNIEDIINLESLSNRWELFKNEKFKSISKLIKPLKELNDFVGINNIKETVFKHLCMFIKKLNYEDDMMHVAITGPPGVGKTTFAHIISKIYLALGFLDNDNVTIAKRSDLIGKYCGHTAVQTQKIIDKSLGGVLLIDEVYSLGNKDKGDVFTKECIDTINQNLTENKGKFLCIIAGYKKEIDECFFSYNPGLERRFPIRYDIPGYNGEELLDIFKCFVEKDKKIILDKDDEFNIKLKEFFDKNYETFINYGGDIEIFWEQIRICFATNHIADDSNIVKMEDIEAGFEEFQSKRNKNKKEDFPNHMYL